MKKYLIICNKNKEHYYKFLYLTYFIFSWQTRFFEIKNNQIFWQKDKYSQKANNYIEIKEIKNIKKIELNDFELECEVKNYLLRAETEELRDKWFDTIQSLKNEISNNNKKKNKFKYQNILNMQLKESLLIKDFENIPDISADKEFLKNKIEKALKTEKYFLLKKKT